MKLYSIKEVARWGAEWQGSGEWQSHTMAFDRSSTFASYYLKLVKCVSGWMPKLGQSTGLDIGAGAGYLAAALRERGVVMTASEWNDNGVHLINAQNPNLPTRLIDVLEFREPESWDFIVCRELYPFTRTNAFSEQYRVVSNLIDSLKPGGVLVLTGSDVFYPHCMDWRLLIRVMRTDDRLAVVSSRYSEAIGSRPASWGLGNIGYRVINALLWPVVNFKKRFTSWADIGVIVFRKKFP